MIEYFLCVVIVLQFAGLIYYDKVSRKERDDLLLKLMSRNLNEYVDARIGIGEFKDEAENSRGSTTPELGNEFIPLEEVPIEQLLKAKNKL